MSDLAATWRSYLPGHVLELLLTAESVSNPPVTQRVNAVILYADVAGFTAMAESLAGTGTYGTEQLTRTINRWFEVTADAITKSGGSVVDFAGDALVGMFLYTPESAAAVARRAVRCAELIREATASVPQVSTPAGPQALTIRVGLAGGPLLVMLLGDPAIRLQHLVAGPALDDAITALHRAERGEIVVDVALSDTVVSAETDDPPYAPPAPPTDELERLLTPFLHPAIRARLRSGRHELVNEHRKVTTAFVRLPDLSIDAPTTVLALQHYLAAGVAVIDRYGGHLRHLMADDKGTVLVAVFGAPVSHEDDEERALRCCLELLALPGGPYQGGVTTGPVYSGEVGSDVRREYAVVGDAVNMAARLMQAAPPGRLLIDQATYERARDIVIADGPRTVTAKGKAGPVPAWVALGAHEASPPAPLPFPTEGPLVGRARELGQVHAIVRQVHAGQGRVVWLHGEAGIGKSRLAAEACRITSALGFSTYGSSCRSQGTSASYLVWRSIWRELLEIDPHLPIPDQRAALTDRIARYDGTGQRAPLLAAVVNLPMPDTSLTAQLDQAGRDELLRSTLLACLRDRTAAGPLVLLLEDCHWIDPASLALLDLIARHLAELPVLVLATAREPLPGKLAERDVVEMPLVELTAADADQLTTLRLGERYGRQAGIAPELVQEITEQAGGNAFYIEELVSYVHGRGVDPGDPGALAALHVPDSLQRLVMARIDELTDDEKSAIKVASVIGRRFQPPWITSVYPAAGTTRQVATHLRRLHTLDLTPQVTASPDPEYQFKHPITQEAAYQSITHDTRASLHERVGLFVEDSFADRLSQYVDVLAHHYGRTARTDKQRIWFRAAGDHAKAMFANEAATHYYERLLPLLPEAEQAALHVEIGTIHQHTGQWAAAEEHYRQAIVAAEANDRRDILAAGQRQLGDLLMYTHSYVESVSWLERARAGFERLGDAAGLSRTMDRMTFALFRQGSYGEMLAMAQQHLTMATEAGDLSAMSIADTHMGLAYLNTGRLDAALDHLRRSLSTAEQAGDRHCMLHAANNLGWASLRSADHVQAIASFRQALDVGRDIGDRHTAEVIVVGNMAQIYCEEGDSGRARTCAMHALRVAVDLRDWLSVADEIADLGTIAAAEGRPDEAQRLLERAIELARELDAPYFLCKWLHRLARLHLSAGRPAVAERLNSEALRVAEEHDERDTQVSAYVLSVSLQVAAGHIHAPDAAAHLRKAADRWTEPHEVAALLDAVWQVDPRDEAARTTAADIYRNLHQRAPSVEYRHACQRLTGELLPPGPPLPELPEWITAERGPDLDTLLRRIDRSRRDAEAA